MSILITIVTPEYRYQYVTGGCKKALKLFLQKLDDCLSEEHYVCDLNCLCESYNFDVNDFVEKGHDKCPICHNNLTLKGQNISIIINKIRNYVKSESIVKFCCWDDREYEFKIQIIE